jgi:hypothetical protein
VVDVDSASVTATLTLANVAAGVISGGGFAATAIPGEFSFTGTAAEVQAALAAVTFDSADNFNGTTSVAVAITDGENGPQGTNPSGTVDITVNAVNDAPVLDDSQSPVLDIVQEDAGPPPTFFPADTLVSDLVGSGNVTDIDDGAFTGMAITGADESNGTWWYSIDGGFSWDVVGPVSDASARVLAADFATRLYFEAAPGFSATASITFRAWDQTDGSASGDGGIDTTPGGGISAFSAVSDTATVEVNAQPDINDIDGDAVTFTEGDSFVMLDAIPTAASVRTSTPPISRAAT